MAPLSEGSNEVVSGEENAGYGVRPLLWSHHGEGYDPRLASVVGPAPESVVGVRNDNKLGNARCLHTLESIAPNPVQIPGISPPYFSGGCVGQEKNCCRVQSSDQIDYCCRIEAIAPQSPRRGSDKQGRCLRRRRTVVNRLLFEARRKGRCRGGRG